MFDYLLTKSSKRGNIVLKTTLKGVGMKNKVIYYSNESEDNFSGDNITPRKIDGSYVYDKPSRIHKIACFFWYRVVATPLAFIYAKTVYQHKTENREVLKKYENTGYFMYGNHTHNYMDPCIPSIISFPRDCYIIVHPNNVSMPILGKLTPYMGAIPLPDDIEAYSNFISVMKKRIEEKKTVGSAAKTT